MGAGKQRRRWTAALCVAGALVVGGCGSSSSSTSKNGTKTTAGTQTGSQTSSTSNTSGVITPVIQAAAASTTAQGVKMTMKMTISGAGLPGSFGATGSGTYSTAAKEGQFNLAIDLSSIPGASMIASGGALTFQEVMKGTTVYMKLPPLLGQILGGGKPWLKLDLAQLAGQSGLGSLVGNPASSNPAALLQYLKGVSGSVKQVGSATINGVPTTEYQGQISLSQLETKLQQTDPSLATQQLDQLKSMVGNGTIPVSVWIDNQHLVRRMNIAFNGTGTTQTKANMTIDFTDYGAQPAPTFPPASQVGDGGPLLGNLSKLASSVGGGSGTSSTPAIP